MIPSLLLGALVGLILGLLGGGGSVLAIPLLTYGLDLQPKAAIVTSLWVVGIAALVASLVHARAGNVRYRIALAFGLIGGVGAALGAQLARLLPGAAQLILFAGVMLIAGVRMIRSPAPDEESGEASLPISSVWTPTIGLAALATGVVTGVVGVGGGFLIVPSLVFLVGLPMRQAIGTSLAVIVLNAVGGSLGYGTYIEVDLSTALPFVFGAGLAGALGSLLGQRVSPRKLRTAFGVGVVVLAIGMGARESWALRTHAGRPSGSPLDQEQRLP